MERNTQIWVGVVVLAALAGGVYYKAKEDAKIGTSQTTSADLPEIKAGDDVDKISIANADKGEVVLEKKGDKWVLTKPVSAPANQTAVKSLLDNMKDLKAKEVISSTPSDDQKKEFQFADNKDVHVVASKGADKKLDVRFGKSGARGQMAMVEGKPGIYAVSGYSSYVYARETKGWRDAEILKFDEANVNQLTIAKKDGTFSFTKAADHWGGTFKDKPIAGFDEDKVKDALRAFKALNADDFGDGKTPADTGLDAPESTVTIQLKDNAAKYVLKLGKTATGTSRYLEKEGDSTPFVVAQYVSDWALADTAKFQKPADAGAGDGGKKDGNKLEMPGMPGMPGMPPGMGGMGNPHGMGDPHGH
jgi:Domain of unknown function (DUF4340)